MGEEQVKAIVEKVLHNLPENKLGLKVAEGGVHCVDGHWWAMLDVQNEPKSLTPIWDAIAEVEGLLEDESPDLKIHVSAA